MTSGEFMGDMARRFGGGVVVHSMEPPTGAREAYDGPGAGIETMEPPTGARAGRGGGGARYGDCWMCSKIGWTRWLGGMERCLDCADDFRAARGADGE